jgi:hypothetical protein
LRAPSGRWTLTAPTWNKTPMTVSAVWPRPMRGKTNDVCCAPETRTATELPTRHASSVTTPCSAAAHSLPTEKTVPAIKATIKSLIKCAQNALTVLFNLPSATVAFAPYAQLARQTAQQGATSADQCVCPPGTKSTFDYGCALCEPGTENPRAGGNCSDNCSAGSVAAARGTTRCSLCPAGFYAENTLRCRPCPFGTYTDRMGSSNCTPCAPNRFSRLNGSSSCGVCQAATFAEEGESQCHDCYNNVLRLRWLAVGPLANTVRGYFVMPLLLLAILVLGVVGLVLAARYRQLLWAQQASKMMHISKYFTSKLGAGCLPRTRTCTRRFTLISQ